MLAETIVDEKFIAEMDKYRQAPQGQSLAQMCSQNVVLFAEKMLGMKLRAWQIYVLKVLQDRIDGKNDFKEFAVLTSRQIGKSTMVAVFSLWLVVFNKVAAGLYSYTPICIVSAADEQAKKLLREIKKVIRMGDKFMAETYIQDDKAIFGKHFFTDLIDEKEPNNTDTITLKSYDKEKHGEYLLKGSKAGSFIKSHPPTQIVLGNTYAFVIVDEAGRKEISDEVFIDFIRPTTNEFKAPLIYTSTPWTPSGVFYETVDEQDEHLDPRVFRVKFTIDAIKLEAPERYEDTMKDIEALNAKGKTSEVQRGFYCRFVQGEKSYFDPDKVKDVFTKDYQMAESYTGPCDMGIDFGGKEVSRSIITIAYQDDKGVAHRLYHRCYEPNKDLSLLDDIAELLTRFNVQRIIPDDCPAGWHFINIMVEKGWNVTPMQFRTFKVKKYGGFRAKLNRGEIESYIDNDLRTEMLALEQSEGGKQSYIMAAPGYHDDMIDSFVMACFYFVDEEKSFKYYDMSEVENEED